MMRNFGDLLLTPCRALVFRFISILSLGFCVVSCLCLWYEGPDIQRVGKGAASPEEFNEILNLVLTTLVLQFGGLVGIYFGVKGFHKLANEMIYGWQGWISVIGIVLFSVFIPSKLYWNIKYADYV